jgi:hypothetical protein
MESPPKSGKCVTQLVCSSRLGFDNAAYYQPIDTQDPQEQKPHDDLHASGEESSIGIDDGNKIILHKVLLNTRVFAFSFKSGFSQGFSGMTSLIETSAVNPYLAVMFQSMNFSSLTFGRQVPRKPRLVGGVKGHN